MQDWIVQKIRQTIALILQLWQTYHLSVEQKFSKGYRFISPMIIVEALDAEAEELFWGWVNVA